MKAACNSTGAPLVDSDVPTNLPPDVHVVDVKDAIEPAVEAFYKIWRLSERAVDELDQCNVDGRIFLDHIAQLCFRHGKALDEIYTRISGGICVGYFRGFSEADYESPLPRRADRSEVANG